MLILNNISKKLGGFHLGDINLRIDRGTYYVLLGRSGSGKTKLLELIAGLLMPDSGEIWLEGEDITLKKLQKRGIGLVFQDYAIFPHMNVRRNIEYPLGSLKVTADEKERLVTKIADELNILHLLDRSTKNLSGGELQRVALARTLITSPRLLLLDEPMASIDASLKDDIRRLLRRLNANGLTIIHVTHDYREAVSLAGRVGVIHNGRIVQEGTPSEVFRRPVNRFVARYAGIRNFYRASLSGSDGSWKATTEKNLNIILPGTGYPANGMLILRSDDIRLNVTAPGCGPANMFQGIVKDIIPAEYGVEAEVDAGETFYVDLTTETYNRQPFPKNAEVWISFPPEACIVLKSDFSNP